MKRLAIGLVVAALAAAAAFAYGGEKVAPRVALPVIKIEQAGLCVAPTDEMRRNHMTMLLHQRDRTVRAGLRETRFSLKGCVDCHAERASGSVLGAEGFCSSCHQYASVKIDCFECHSPLRQTRVGAAR